MARRIALSFAKNLYVFLILLLSDPFDILERWGGVSYKPPSWLFWVLLAVAIGLASWRTVEDTKKGIRNEEKLDSIKNTLVTIGKYQRDAAIQQGGMIPNKLKARITQDLIALYPISHIESVIEEGLRGNVEPLLNFYEKFGDILDANGCGLKLQLQSNPQYNDALADLTSKLVTLRLARKKTELIQSNIIRIRKGGYGLNSGIVLRNMLKTSHSRGKSEDAVIHSVVVSLEALENIGQDFLTYGLNHLDTKWKPKFGPEQLATPQLQVMMGRMSQLNKKRFGVLHAFKDVIKRNLP